MRSTRNHRTSSRSRHHAVRYQFGVTADDRERLDDRGRIVARPVDVPQAHHAPVDDRLLDQRAARARRCPSASNNSDSRAELARRSHVGLAHRRHDLRERGASRRRERRRRCGLQAHGDRRRLGGGEVRRAAACAPRPGRSRRAGRSRRRSRPRLPATRARRARPYASTPRTARPASTRSPRGLRARNSSTIAYSRSVRFIAGRGQRASTDSCSSLEPLDAEVVATGSPRRSPTRAGRSRGPASTSSAIGISGGMRSTPCRSATSRSPVSTVQPRDRHRFAVADERAVAVRDRHRRRERVEAEPLERVEIAHRALRDRADAAERAVHVAVPLAPHRAAGRIVEIFEHARSSGPALRLQPLPVLGLVDRRRARRRADGSSSPCTVTA